MQRSDSLYILRVDVRAPGQKETQCELVRIKDCPVKSRAVFRVRLINNEFVTIEKICDNGSLISLGCELESTHSRVILYVDIGSIINQLSQKLQISIKSSVVDCSHS